jgi:GMP synthase (glutamine-hydrolysing)
MEFNAKKFIKESVEELEKKTQGKKALVATSGGVDSVVCALLAKQAMGDRLVVLFLDNGLMREGEAEETSKFFKSKGIELQVWDMKERFLEGLKGKSDPEEKRKEFREIFYKTLAQALKSYSVDFLIQGTIRTDIIETQKGIKTQHNVLSQIGLNPVYFGLKIIEPPKEIYKNHVRRVAKELKLAKKVYERKPFPGPGLATRIIGEVTAEKLDKIRVATTIVEKAIKSEKVFQVFPVIFSDKATGMDAEGRIYGDIIAIRAVESKDAIKAKPYRIPWPKLEKIRDEIFKKVPGVVKVLYDITPKPPSTIEYI